MYSVSVIALKSAIGHGDQLRLQIVLSANWCNCMWDGNRHYLKIQHIFVDQTALIHSAATYSWVVVGGGAADELAIEVMGLNLNIEP